MQDEINLECIKSQGKIGIKSKIESGLRVYIKYLPCSSMHLREVGHKFDSSFLKSSLKKEI